MAAEQSPELVDLIGDKAKKVILWHNPVVSGVTFSVGLAVFLFMAVRQRTKLRSARRVLTQS
jgi:hypothetical protein